MRAFRCTGERAEALQLSLAIFERLHVATDRRGKGPNSIIANLIELGFLAITVAGLFWVVLGMLAPAQLAAVMVVAARSAEPLATFLRSWLCLYVRIGKRVRNSAAGA